MKAFLNKRLFLRGSILVFALFTLQGCMVSKNYERPDLEEETENLYRTDNLPTDSLSMADVSWKEVFTDPYLVQYIEEGLQNNIDIRMALQQIIAGEAYMKQGKAGYLPTLSAGATATHQELSKNSQFGSFFNGSLEQYEMVANLSWEADIWGKIRSNKRAFQAGYLQSVAAHQAVKTKLIESIATTYYRLLALDAQLKITQQTVETRANSVETIKALKDAGQETQVAVDQNIAQYNNARALQVDIEREIFKTENTLSILLAKQPQHYERGVLDHQEITTEMKLGVPYLLLRNRPDVMAAEFDFIESFELTNVALTNFYPSLTLSASGGFQSLEFQNWFNTNSLFANLVGGLTQPIFNQRKIRTQYEVSQAQQEQALLNFKKTLLEAGKEVSEALYAYDAETTKFEYRKEEVEALRRAETNSEALLNNGYATYLDLLTVRQSELAAELNMIDTKLEQLLSVVNLYKALGGGWK
ncbi:RND efflux system, outer membrane lipoprotein CmeC [Xanthomarina gelatinilytica]|uniref:RND efflux system, outer membrane lipoprotein CmeC n=2 Tax=Xanthomarina gelatinilytica TaxID=1137281 RepID=M7MLR2_9FLAO|nr:efflux transporter outer membrane subunit [Xanthomarina gelatinilytica]EMQ95815.1 RND efflux system, outer membrane lipoprotein CmeC [Xanthomarina gelatinilytica]